METQATLDVALAADQATHTLTDAGLINRLFSDRRRQISRPKLIFTIAAFDAVAVATAGLASLMLSGDQSTAVACAYALAMALACCILLQRNWAYTIQALRTATGQAERVLTSLVVAFCILTGLAQILALPPPQPSTTVIWFAVAGVALLASRLATRQLIAHLTTTGRLSRKTVIVGGGPDAEQLIRAVEAEKLEHIEILGVFDDRNDDRSSDSFAGYAKLGNFKQLAAFCRASGVDLLIVTVGSASEQRLLQILGSLMTIPADIRISALGAKLRLASKAYNKLGTIPMLAVMDRPLTDWDRAVKNLEDRCLGAALFVLFAPVMALAALAIRLDTKGPVFFKQRRYGFNNELIEVYKFRSMHVIAADANASKLVTKDDPRVTRVGRILRKTSLDELPQLFNVLRGDMSLVGPRPHATQAKAQSDLYQTVVDGYFARHRMKPGVTGWAQINGWRGETDTHEKIQRRVECDLHYIDNWSLAFDLRILALTPISLLSSKNAY